MAQTVKRLPTVWETQVQSLGREDLLEKEIAAHSSTLAWKIPWTEEHGRLQFMGSQRVRHDWATSLFFTEKHFGFIQVLVITNKAGINILGKVSVGLICGNIFKIHNLNCDSIFLLELGTRDKFFFF